MALTDLEKRILDFEGSWWTECGTKQAAIRRRLSLSASRYYRLLAALADSREAAAYDPLVVSRLRRERTRRRRVQYEGRPAPISQRRGQ